MVQTFHRIYIAITTQTCSSNTEFPWIWLNGRSYFFKKITSYPSVYTIVSDLPGVEMPFQAHKATGVHLFETQFSYSINTICTCPAGTCMPNTHSNGILDSIAHCSRKPAKSLKKTNTSSPKPPVKTATRLSKSAHSLIRSRNLSATICPLYKKTYILYAVRHSKSLPGNSNSWRLARWWTLLAHTTSRR